jgi:hypothetical protein
VHLRPNQNQPYCRTDRDDYALPKRSTAAVSPLSRSNGITEEQTMRYANAQLAVAPVDTSVVRPSLPINIAAIHSTKYP